MALIRTRYQSCSIGWTSCVPSSHRPRIPSQPKSGQMSCTSHRERPEMTGRSSDASLVRFHFRYHIRTTLPPDLVRATFQAAGYVTETRPLTVRPLPFLLPSATYDQRTSSTARSSTRPTASHLNAVSRSVTRTSSSRSTR